MPPPKNDGWPETPPIGSLYCLLPLAKKGEAMKKADKKMWALSRKNAWVGRAFLAPLMLGCMVFYAVPLTMVLWYSLTSGMGASRKFVWFLQYEKMLDNDIFRLAFGNTMAFLAIALPLILLISFAIALLLKECAKRHAWLKSVILMPYIMPVVGTVLLIEQLFAATGLVNHALYTLGLPIVQWLQTEYAFVVVVLLYLWKNTGYSVVLLLSGLTAIPDDLYEVASIDGAKKLQQHRYITLPHMWYSFFFATVFSLINAFKCFREIFLIGGTHPHDSIYMLLHFINNSFEKMSYPKLAVASILLLTLLVFVFAFLYRLVLRKEAYKE